MWDDPVTLNRVSRLLLLATAVFVLYMGGRQAVETWLPIRIIEVHGAAHTETRQELRSVLASLRGGLVSMDLAAARLGFEALPWVRRATVRRVWPGRLRVDLQEHVPAAAWNDQAVLDIHGEVFAVRPWPGLPRFSAQEGLEGEVARRYGEFARRLAPYGWRVAAIRVDARYAWQLVLNNGVSIDLGQERLDERLRRFVVFYPPAAARVSGIRRVDMRYPNGFAVSGATSNETRT